MVLATALRTLGTAVALSADMSTMKAHKAATRFLQNLLPCIGVADNLTGVGHVCLLTIRTRDANSTFI